MKKSAAAKSNPSGDLPSPDQLVYEQAVSHRAYEIWETGGCRHGEDAVHWAQAEREVQAIRTAKASAARI